mgnify:CR=1 FL=1
MIQSRIVKYYAKKDPNIAIKVIPGHFVSTHSHLNNYLDMTTMKTRQNEAERIAIAMKDYYNVMGKPIDTIVCIEGCEVIGAFLASELSRAGILSMNAHKTIYVVTPEFNNNGQMIFRDNLKPEIAGKNVLLLLASATTGKTVRNSIECIQYYGGILQGISSIFSAVDSIDGHKLMHCLEPMTFQIMKRILMMIVLFVKPAKLWRQLSTVMDTVNYNCIQKDFL